MVCDGLDPGLDEVTRRYDFRLTPHLRELLNGRPANDPLARQFLPDVRELTHLPVESADPIGDDAHSPVPGIVHRYPDRVLLKASHACAVYCRFCFRRERVGSHGTALRDADLERALDYVRAHEGIWEVILTGGDPLAISNRRLTRIMAALARIEHVGSIRLHTRAPVVEPDRIDASCLAALDQPKAVHLALHVNHPDELGAPTCAAIERLARAGVVLLSQTVLLQGVNDDAAVLEALYRRLVRLKVRPYYLHHPDLAPGTSHLRVSIETGQEIMRVLRTRMSGIAQPTYVLDIPGGFGKVPIGPAFVAPRAADATRVVRDAHGREHHYPE